jgi:uncharacterized protein YjbJ (UPF0337 family)
LLNRSVWQPNLSPPQPTGSINQLEASTEYAMTLNKETVSGKFDQVAGKVKEKIGEATGNQKLANAGAADQIKGAAKETWGKVKDTANAANENARAQAEVKGDSFSQRAEEKARELREKLTTSAHNAKEHINEKLDHIKHDQQAERDNIRRS